ncbi:MAG: NAD(+) synthase [Chloroflexota bacterium]
MQQLHMRLVDWIRSRVTEAGAAGTVVGLSGGIDSAVVAALCHEALGDRALALALPINSLSRDVEDATLVAQHFGLQYRLVPLEGAYGALFQSVPDDLGDPAARSLALANLKPRLRMAVLYYFANAQNYLVVGTSNKAERTVGYFTKWGDGAADILPIAGLTKGQVRTLAAHLGVPRPVIDKAPSAGLWAGQTDESEMGITYDAIDAYLTAGSVDPATVVKIEARFYRSQHKRERPPVAPVDDIVR